MIEKAISTFIQSLSANWISVQELEEASKQQGLLADWAQASWEAIVEASMPFETRPVRLVVYADGADCHPSSSRFSSCDELPTHEIRCGPLDEMVVDRLSGRLLQKISDGYAFDRFVSFQDGWFFERPPFDHALIETDGRESVVALDRLTWALVKVKEVRGSGSLPDRP